MTDFIAAINHDPEYMPGNNDTNPLADEVRNAALELHRIAHETTLCEPDDDRYVRLSPEQAHAIANAFEHIADDMDDYGATEETEGIVNGPSVRDENGNSRFDWSAILGAARTYLDGQAERDVANAVNLMPTDPAMLAGALDDLEATFPDDGDDGDHQQT